ncbi:MAG: hypothetical protein ACFFFB_13990 [Candidatus Heimdallarchaeota archaeon]
MSFNRILYGKKMIEDFLSETKPVSSTLHRKTIRHKKKQFIKWILNRCPAQNEVNILAKFFLERGFIPINNDSRRFQFRKFFDNGTSVHVSIWKKHYGFNIDAHIDLSPHGNVIFTLVTLRLLSALYIYLQSKYGSVFLLPRQKKEYQGYVSNFLPLERVIRKKNRPKRKLR